MCLLHLHVPFDQHLQLFEHRLQLLDLAVQTIGRRCCCVGGKLAR